MHFCRHEQQQFPLFHSARAEKTGRVEIRKGKAMTAIGRKAISTGDTEKAKQMTSARQPQDALAGVSRAAGQAAADAWTNWLTAWQDLAAQQVRLFGQMMDRVARSPFETLPALREPGTLPVHSVRIARENCQRLMQGVRAANDAALGWYFDMADRAATQFAQQLSSFPSTTNGTGASASDRAHQDLRFWQGHQGSAR